MRIDVSQVLDVLFLVLDHIFPLSQLLLHLHESGVRVQDLLVELLLLLPKLKLYFFAVCELLEEGVFVSLELLMGLPQVIIVPGDLGHLVREVIPPLQQLLLILLLALFQSHIELFAVPLHIVDQADVVLLEFLVLDPVLLFYLLQRFPVLRQDRLQLLLVRHLALLICLHQLIMLLVSILEFELVVIIDFFEFFLVGVEVVLDGLEEVSPLIFMFFLQVLVPLLLLLELLGVLVVEAVDLLGLLIGNVLQLLLEV
mmetsp:Transcript_12726/g.12578  ORF Transcript_12726/g.12578 Transcript_12726/m.12578 type:complete len:256 (+) Transcript_12726:546-1313(+)